jgi:hypothetical protein
VIMPRTERGHFGPLEQPEVVAHHIAQRYAGAAPAQIGAD